MDALELIKSRRSIRAFTEESVTPVEIEKLLEAAMAAPSAHNLRPWQFVVVTDAELRQQLGQTNRYTRMAAQAPVVFVVCGNSEESGFWIEDTSAATENLLLEAVSLGLGAVWCGIHHDPASEKHVRQTLGIPEHIRVLSLVPVGRPGEQKPARTQYDADRVYYERYGQR